MEFNEKFIGRNIGDLASTYDKIHGQNVNLQRIAGDYIDGLKPVQRRSLYVMFLKDGGKTFRKLATISGEVFGRTHPHCLVGSTRFIFSDGSKRSLEELYNAEPDNLEVLTYTKEGHGMVGGHLHSVRITKYVDHYHEIRLSSGGLIGCTEDHEILVMRPGESGKLVPIWVRADEIVIGDLLYGMEMDVSPFEVIASSPGNRIPGYKKITVTEIMTISGTNQIPMYDYTVDEYGCGGIYVGPPDIDTFSFAIVKNSPVAIENAIVNMEQPWHNLLPLVEGEGNFGSCHDNETKVLTRDGWKYFEDITRDDELASVDPETLNVIYEHPVQIIEFPYDGNLILCQHPCVDFAVTPNHMMYASLVDPDTDQPGTYEFTEARNLGQAFYVLSGTEDRIDEFAYNFTESHCIDASYYVHEVPYHGMVYCAEVPTYHTLITMRNGKILISGNCSGDRAGASRYIKARLSKFAIACFFEDWKDSVVDMEMAYDEETMVPLFLPAKYPNILLNGCLGIGSK